MKQKLRESGQDLAARRFWPFVSPPVLLLSVLNIIAAVQSDGAVRPVWLLAGALALLDKAATYLYFVPTMIFRISRPEAMSAPKLRTMVRLWVGLSPLRNVVAGAAFLTFLSVLTRV